ncbi:MAG: squalene/phytoene synthase family protein [Alphaproteobacteria bacterium]|nr:squalene/phytoene synthase family protein [Alphaproteobacteria bacterium]
MLSVGDLVKKSHPALFWCMRSLPKVKREALFTLFAFCRHIDNIARSDMPVAEKKELIKAWYEELVNIYDKHVPATNIGRKIYKNCLRFNLPRKKLEEILASATLNIPKPLCAPKRIIFEQYINGAAVVPFELALQIMDAKNSAATEELAKNLGRAVLLTLILRDVKDDAKGGRLYMPEDILKRTNLENIKPMQIIESPDFALARELLAGEAELAFMKAERLIRILQSRSAMSLRYIENVSQYLFAFMKKRGWEIISPKPKLHISAYLLILWRVLFK